MSINKFIKASDLGSISDAMYEPRKLEQALLEQVQVLRRIATAAYEGERCIRLPTLSSDLKKALDDLGYATKLRDKLWIISW